MVDFCNEVPKRPQPTPEDLEPVLAKIRAINDLGISTYHEVVYYSDGSWHSVFGSNTFDNGESVICWTYIPEDEYSGWRV